MANTYHAKKVFRVVDRELLQRFFAKFETQLPVDWTLDKPKKFTNELFEAFLSLDDGLKTTIESALHEIHSVIQREQNAKMIHGLLNFDGIIVPNKIKDGCIQDLAMWLYLESESLWIQCIRYALTDKCAERFWFVRQLPCDLDYEKDYSDDQFEAMKREICAFVYKREGRGKHAYVEYFEREGRYEYFFVYLSNYITQTMQWRGGEKFNREFDYSSYEMVFIYDRKERQLQVKTTGVRDYKLCLCMIWAEAMRNTKITDDEREKPSFNVEPLINGDYALPPDADGKVKRAFVTALGLNIRGCPGSKRVFEEPNGGIHEKIQNECSGEIYNSMMVYPYMAKIRIELGDEYGRSRNQTITITEDSCNIHNKNPKVRDVLQDCLKRWNLVAA